MGCMNRFLITLASVIESKSPDCSICFEGLRRQYIEYTAVAGSLNKRLMLSSSFWCDQIYKYEIYNFGHTLCFLSPT